MLPLLTPGYVLSYDMVFVPRYRFSADLAGISQQVPRAVPTEGVVAVLSRVLPGDVLEKVFLLGVFVLAVAGMARLVPARRVSARLAAGILYAWNPFVYERLLIGHWFLLVGYAALPWVAGAALDLRRSKPGAVPRLGLWLGLAGLAGPYSGILAAGVAVLFGAAPPWPGPRVASLRRAGWALGLGILVNLPWLVPSILRPGGLPSTAAGLHAFAARSDSPLGTVGSLLSLGGMWNTDLAPPGRSSWIWIPSFFCIVAVAAVGWWTLRKRWPRFATTALVAGAAIGLALATGDSVPGLAAANRWIALHAPGGGLLRDSQKFVPPLALALAVGFGMGVERILDAAPPRATAARAGAVILAILPISLVPTLAWGAGNGLASVRYPASWSQARAVMAADPVPGSVLVLPWHLYLPFAWNDGHIVLDPAQRFFTRPALTTERLELRSGTLPSEDPLARRADRVVSSGRPLGPALPSLGARYLLVLKEADWRQFNSRVGGLQRVFDSPELTLFRSPAAPRATSQERPPAAPIVAADAVVLFALIALLAARLRSSAGFA
ncbi:MAG: hypothetical protein M3Q23_08465 [Actinomycetota bacterium]|nr:hypothetical protein [Actinomycetota bacterium]